MGRLKELHESKTTIRDDFELTYLHSKIEMIDSDIRREIRSIMSAMLDDLGNMDRQHYLDVRLICGRLHQIDRKVNTLIDQYRKSNQMVCDTICYLYNTIRRLYRILWSITIVGIGYIVYDQYETILSLLPL